MTVSNSFSKNTINNNVNIICSCFDNLDNNIEKINVKINEVSDVFFKLSYNMSDQATESNSYLKFQIELLKNEKKYYQLVKSSVKQKFVKDLYLIAESIIMLLSSLENIHIDNIQEKKTLLKRINFLKKYNSNLETSEVLELINSIIYNLELVDKFIKIFEKYIKDTIIKNKRENLHCNNFRINLENKKQFIRLEHNKYKTKLIELIEYFLTCSQELNEQLKHQQLLNFLIKKKEQ